MCTSQFFTDAHFPKCSDMLGSLTLIYARVLVRETHIKLQGASLPPNVIPICENCLSSGPTEYLNVHISLIYRSTHSKVLRYVGFLDLHLY